MAKEKRKATQAQMEYIERYDSINYDRVLIRFPKGTKERIQETGASVNGFTVRAVLDNLDAIENQAPGQ